MIRKVSTKEAVEIINSNEIKKKILDEKLNSSYNLSNEIIIINKKKISLSELKEEYVNEMKSENDIGLSELKSILGDEEGYNSFEDSYLNECNSKEVYFNYVRNKYEYIVVTDTEEWFAFMF